MLAPQIEQKPLLAILDEWYHFKVALLIKLILSSGH
jgi:hypothetical protein